VKGGKGKRRKRREKEDEKIGNRGDRDNVKNKCWNFLFDNIKFIKDN
jgi:hypothetical protein